MSTEHDIAALNDLLVGVEMDRNSLPDGDAKVAALGRAIARLRGKAAQSPSYAALQLIVNSMCGAMERAGISDCDDPGEALDVMRERYEARIAELLAQGEQQAVAWYVRYAIGEKSTLPVTFRSREEAQAHADKCEVCEATVEPLYPRPQPVAVAGDAVRLLPYTLRAMATNYMRGEGRHQFDHLDADVCTRAAAAIDALSAAPAAPACPNDDTGAAQLHRHNVFAYEVDFGDEGKGQYVRLADFNRVAELVPDGAPAPVAGDAVDGWERMTDEAKRIQRRHVDSHHGDVYHAMQSLCVSFGKPDKRPMFPALAQDRASQAGAAGVPEGWRLVPVEPTDAMIDAAADVDPERESVWAAYLAAAPTPAAEGEVR